LENNPDKEAGSFLGIKNWRNEMKNKERKNKRFLRDPLPIRLAGLAADLARIASSARHASGAASVDEMLEESQYYIEWTAAEIDPEIAGELVDIQRLIALWRSAWPEAQHSVKQRTLLSVQAKKWSDQVLNYSGMLKEA
jgi:hypothetical protein